MTAPECAAVCTRPSPSAVICPVCTASLRATLDLAASIEPDLADAAARLLRHGGGGRRSGDEQPLPVDLHATAAAAELRECLAWWVKAIHAMPYRKDDPWPADTIAAMGRWLADRTDAIRHHDQAHEMLGEIRDAVAACLGVLDGPPERHPAGTCACGRALYAPPGADSARCTCGEITTGIAEARAKRAAEADVLGDAEAISRALAAIGKTVSGGTIRKWKERGRIPERPGGVLAMSDVLAMVAERDSRKAGR